MTYEDAMKCMGCGSEMRAIKLNDAPHWKCVTCGSSCPDNGADDADAPAKELVMGAILGMLSSARVTIEHIRTTLSIPVSAKLRPDQRKRLDRQSAAIGAAISQAFHELNLELGK